MYHKVELAHGDLCTMEGLFQKHYQHAVEQEYDKQEPRINLTWRWVVAHETQCRCHRRYGDIERAR